MHDWVWVTAQFMTEGHEIMLIDNEFKKRKVKNSYKQMARLSALLVYWYLKTVL